MRKQFNLEYYLKHPNVQIRTRDGKRVRIICTNRLGRYNIVALILNINKNETIELLYSFNNYGKTFKFGNSSQDLFFEFPDNKDKKDSLKLSNVFKQIKRLIKKINNMI